ncbi:nitroreductase family protein [Sphingobium sp.]|uniref:nitroreductase family protein n=1 Tax=Sphingobium sp. TaxID=1912891 RepID=UPI003B3A171F
MATTPRATTRAVDSLFLDRWSPRAFDSSAISQDDLDTIFDAARWAPSAFNYQPWRFLYAHRDSADWQRFLDILLPFNQSWVQHAGALIFVLSDTLSAAPGSQDFKPSHSHSFDAGAAWALLALQATRLGYHTHGMTGVDFDKARVELAVPDRFRIEAAVAIGRQGDKSILPEALQSREFPSDRKDIAEFAHPGNFAA